MKKFITNIFISIDEREVNCIFNQDRGFWLDESNGFYRKTRAWLAPLITRKTRPWLAAFARLLKGHARLRNKAATIIVQGEEDHLGRALMTGAMVTAAAGANYRRPDRAILALYRHAAGFLQLLRAARHGVPNGKLHGPRIPFTKENAAMATVPHSVIPPADVGDARAEFRGGDERWDRVSLLGLEAIPGPELKEAEHGRNSMKLTVASAEARAGEEGQPGLAGEGGTDETRGLVRWEAQ
jgi:hypothetical protein